VQRGLEAMREGRAIPTVRETVAASEKLAELETVPAPSSPDLVEEFDATMEALQEIVPPEQWAALVARVRELRHGAGGRPISGVVSEAEVESQ
jgi:hypothetical protein